jgi:hypothetical protein
VTVDNRGDITTGDGIFVHGLSADGQIATNESGIVAQSTGGGGLGGNALSLIPGLSGGDSTYTLTVDVGGKGGPGGLGGIVKVSNTAAITTFDTESYGIFAQSISDGGGKGGNAVAVPGVLVNKTNTFNIGISVGGEGGKGAASAPVTVTNDGSVTTHGDGSHGIFAQSVGGGGGDGGSAFNYFIGGSTVTTKASINVNYSLGGKGGSGGAGSTVDVTNDGTIKTTGDGSNAIEAQSIGGGGEAGNASNVILPSTLWKTASLNVGGDGGKGDDSAAVTITQNSGAAITTTGDESSGIYAQSIGGGGRGGVGTLALSLTVGLGGKGGENGNGGAATVNVNGGTITTEGSGTSAGIFAQSVGGGGQAGGVGLGIIDTPKFSSDLPSWIGKSIPMGSGKSTGNGGNVTVKMNGAITTKGEDAIGVFAQSVGSAVA